MRSLKTIIFITVFAFIAKFTSSAQDGCSTYYPMAKGIKFELTHFDKSGKKVTGKTRNEITEYSNSGGKEVATIHTIVEDKKGEETFDASYSITCTGDKVVIDLKEMMKEQMAEQMKDEETEIEISGINAGFPNSMTVGQKLPDSNIDMKIKAGSINLNFTVNSTNREVVDKETITTPAGTFDCIVISSESHTKMMVSKTTLSKMWLAKGYGMVKQEDYNKKGKLTGSQVLTSFSK